MKINVEAFILCWNEELIIRHTLRHYASFCTNITLLDNNSTDQTVPIVRKEFPEVRVVPFDTNNEIREDMILDLKNNCWKESKADYVIVCDTDEFLYAGDMLSQLQALYEKKVIMPVVIGYNMGSLKFPGNNSAPLYKQVRTGIRDSRFDKQIIFSRRRVSEINYAPGCHVCNPVFKRKRPRDQVVLFNLLHFKYLGREYLYKKHAEYARRMSRFNIEHGYWEEHLEGRKHIDQCFELIDHHLYRVI